MTDRFKGLTVTLKRDIREDDAQRIIESIEMIKGVQDVTPVKSTGDDHINRERIRREFREKILELHDELSNL